MAVTKIWTVDTDFQFTINYAVNPDKTVTAWAVTEDGEVLNDLKDVINYASRRDKTNTVNEDDIVIKEYVTGINCCKDTAYNEMLLTKLHYCKTDKVLAWHGYQSFAQGEITAEQAHEIGVRLAEKLWGDRFQVVVTTHLDKKHIHNHFVVNSVSFLDGCKYYGNRTSYFKMRDESDALCREYGLSVVENPTYNGVSRGAYRAEKEGRYSIEKIVREDIDRMIKASIDIDDFLRRLKWNGYRIDPSGRYVTVFPYGHSSGIRIDRRWGNSYSIEGIARQIEYNRLRGEIAVSIKKTYKAGSVKYPNRKLTGYQALYVKYLFMLGKIPQNRGYTNKQVHFLMREELLKLDTMKKEMDFLRKNNIESDVMLEREKAKRQISYNELVSERKLLRNKIRRAPDFKKQELNGALQVLNRSIRELRTELFYCRDIAERSVRMSEKLNKVNEIHKDMEKENGGMRHGRFK